MKFVSKLVHNHAKLKVFKLFPTIDAELDAGAKLQTIHERAVSLLFCILIIVKNSFLIKKFRLADQISCLPRKHAHFLNQLFGAQIREAYTLNTNRNSQ